MRNENYMAEASSAMLQTGRIDTAKVVGNVSLVTEERGTRDNLELVAFEDTERHLYQSMGAVRGEKKESGDGRA